MKFPLDWIAEFARVEAPAEEIASRLTRSGMVVDAIEGDGEETVLDIDVPTNRPDAMNVYGIARELAAAMGARLAPYPAGVAEQGDAPAASLASVSIEEETLCRRYCARVIRGVRVDATPDWMARRLRNAGLNVLNNVVDVTNYVLWELGHPLHAFDLGTLNESRIVVRRARRGEKLVTLDGIERTLAPEMLVIADASRAVAIAGVMGGAETMITERTTDLLLESAWFQPVSVRRTAKSLPLSTDASYRFERGADEEAASAAIDRAAALIAEIAGGRVAPGIIDVRPGGQPSPRRLRLRLARITRLLGLEVQSGTARKALESLGFAVKEVRIDGGQGLEVTVPSRRQDVEGEADLVEEVGRIVGYDDVPDRDPLLPGFGAIHRFSHRREDELRASLLSSGFTEVMSIPFVAEAQDHLARPEGQAPLKLTNPMAEGQETLRTSLLPGLAYAVRRNHRHGVRDVRIFEVGRIFHRHGGGPGEPEPGKPGASGAEGIAEPLACALAATGLSRPRHWSDPARSVLFHDLKGAVEEALERIGIPARFDPLDAAPFRPGAALAVIADHGEVGRIGEVAPSAAADLGVRTVLFYAELNLTRLFLAPETPPRFEPLPRFPSVSRDLALVVPHGVLWRDVELAIRKAGGDLVTGVTVFDRYAGGNLPEGHLSLAVNLLFQRPDRTLEAEEVASAESRVLGAIEKEFGITLRR